MLAVLVLRSLGWSPEGPVVEGVEAGRRFGPLGLGFLRPQCLQTVDPSLMFHPLVPVIIQSVKKHLYSKMRITRFTCKSPGSADAGPAGERLAPGAGRLEQEEADGWCRCRSSSPS